MDGTNGGLNRQGDFATLRIQGDDTKLLLSGALQGLAARNGWWLDEPDLARVKSAVLRAEGNVPELLRGLYDGLVELVETFEVKVAGIEIDGLLRGDSGLVTWATVLVLPAVEPVTVPVEIATIETAVDGLEITLALAAG